MDFDLDQPVRGAAKVEPQGSPYGTVAGTANQTDVRPHRSKEGAAIQAVSDLASNAHVGRCSIVERHKPRVQVQTEAATGTVGSEADSAAKAPGLVLMVPEAEQSLGVPDERKAGMEYAVYGNGASCLQLTALGSIPGRMPVGQ